MEHLVIRIKTRLRESIKSLTGHHTGYCASSCVDVTQLSQEESWSQEADLQHSHAWELIYASLDVIYASNSIATAVLLFLSNVQYML